MPTKTSISINDKECMMIIYVISSVYIMYCKGGGARWYIGVSSGTIFQVYPRERGIKYHSSVERPPWWGSREALL